jgi:hypothetical protein
MGLQSRIGAGRGWTSQPKQPVSVVRLRDRLRFVCLPLAPLQTMDVGGVSGRRLGETAPILTQGLHGWRFRSVSNAAFFSNGITQDLDFTAGPFTVFSFFNLSTTADDLGLYARHVYVSDANNNGISMETRQTAPTKFAFTCYNNGDFAATVLQATTPAATTGDHQVVGTSDGVTRRIYVDGFERNSTTNTPNPLTTASALRLGYTNGGNTVEVYLTAAWARALTAVEIAALYANPWMLFGTRGLQPLQAQGGAPVVPPWNAPSMGILRRGYAVVSSGMRPGIGQ